ncbi:MAG TPA: DUF4404 family protein [Anaerolineales bacterium]|nr:DUF4404 family protein [Anaerolineales bacterium]
MDDHNLDSLLEKVHAELQRVDHVDEEGRVLLQELEQDIQALLKKGAVSEALPILERMRKAVEQFEVKYPSFTTLLSEISSILSNAGI